VGIEVRPEDVLTPPILVRVLLPQQRIGCGRVKFGEILLDKRSRFDQFSHQGRLPIHRSSPRDSHSRQTHSPSYSSTALSAAGSIVTPQRAHRRPVLVHGASIGGQADEATNVARFARARA
jgi:hypothetical protein